MYCPGDHQSLNPTCSTSCSLDSSLNMSSMLLDGGGCDSLLLAFDVQRLLLLLLLS